MPGPDWANELVRNASRRLSFAASCVAERAAEVAAAGEAIGAVLRAGGKILVFGNGGSAACAQHFAAEFTGKLSLDRVPLPAVALSTDTSALTAIANDFGFDDVFERQVRALVSPEDIVVGISTSGTSKNVLAGLAAAKQSGAQTVLLCGGSSPADASFTLSVPVTETARIQEAHDLILHLLAAVAERVATDVADDQGSDRYPFILADRDLEDFRSWLATTNQRLVTTNGAFDLLHSGHRSSLRQARAHGDRLVVLVNSDESVRKLKGDARPIKTIADRLEDLQHVSSVDHVVVMPDSDPVRLLRLLRPQVHCKGSEYRDRPMPERDVIEAGGGRIEYLQLADGYSTTTIEEKIRHSNV